MKPFIAKLVFFVVLHISFFEAFSQGAPNVAVYYHFLQDELDASFVKTNETGILYCRFLEKYNNSIAVSAKLYNWKRVEYSLPITVVYGENWLQLNLSDLSLLNREYYTLEVTDQNNLTFYLRIKYINDTVSDDALSLTCPTSGAPCTLFAVNNSTISTNILNGQAPYKIKWIRVSTGGTLYEEETSSRAISRTFNFTGYAVGEQIKLSVTDACGKEASCTFCFSSGGKIATTKNSKFTFFIKSLFGISTGENKKDEKPTETQDKLKN